MHHSVGDPRLDDLLGGGIPEGSAVLVTGPPGIGKTRLALQFLDAGLSAGDECALVSPVATRDAVGRAGEDVIDLDHPKLTFVGGPDLGGGLDPGDGGTDTDDGGIDPSDGGPDHGDGEEDRDDGTADDGGTDPGDGGYPGVLLEGLVGERPLDRVAVDDVDALDALVPEGADPERVGATLAARVRDELDATVLFAGRHPERDRGRSAGEPSAVAGVGTAVDGDLRFRGDRVNGDRRRVFRVRKLAGTDHGTRPVEITLTDGGVRAIPGRPVLPAASTDEERLSTGIAGLDDLLGGGIVRGGELYLTYDGYASPVPLAALSLAEAIEAGYVAVTVPGPAIGYETYDRLSKLLLGKPVEGLLEARDLYILDLLSTRDRSLKFTATDDEFETVQTLSGRNSSLYETLRRLFDFHDRPVYLLLDLEPMFHRHGEREIRELHYWLESALRDTSAVALYLDNLRLIPESLTAFFFNSVDHTLRLWRGERGSEYVALAAGYSGDVGGTRLVEYADEEPYVRLV